MNKLRNIVEKPIVRIALMASLGLTACGSQPASTKIVLKKQSVTEVYPSTEIVYHANGTRSITHSSRRSLPNDIYFSYTATIDQWCDGGLLYSETEGYSSPQTATSSSIQVMPSGFCKDERLTPDDFPDEGAKLGFIVKIEN